MSHSQLHFIREGMHTYLVVPASDLCTAVPQLKTYLEPYNWARVGWGDYRYYGAEIQPVWLGLQALLLPTYAVVSLRAINYLPEQLSKTAILYSITVNQTLMESVTGFVARYFKLNSADQLTRVREKPCGTYFFKSRGIYLAANTCNHWTSHGLRRAGLKLLPRFHFFSTQVERSVRKNGYFPVD